MDWGHVKVNPLNLGTISACDQWRLRDEHDKLREQFPECKSLHPPLCKKACKKEMITMLEKVEKDNKHAQNPFFDLGFSMDEMEEQAWERYPSARAMQRRRKQK